MSAFDDLEAMAARELKQLRESHAELLEALKELAEWHGPTHEVLCPGDDTCCCKYEAFNCRINLSIANADKLK